MSFSKVYVGAGSASFEYSEKRDAITGVRVYLTDDTSVLEGTETTVLEVYIPLCNSTAKAREYAQGILSALSSWQYQPFDAQDMVCDPALQLGDGVNCNGVYGTVFKKTTRFGAIYAQSASAPSDEEINHEYPFIAETERKEVRKYEDLKEDIEAELTVQAGEISAKVSKLSPDGQTSFSWVMDDSAHVWSANGAEVFRLDSTGAHVKGEITATSGDIGGCTIVNGVLQVQAASIKQLSIGSNFSVDTSGNMIANNATITGTLNVGGSLITAANLYTGASQAALGYSGWNDNYNYVSTNGGGWSNGAYYAYSGSGSYYNSIQNGTVSYPTQFKTAYLYVTSGISMSSQVFTPKSTTIAGVTIHYLGW